MAPKILVVLTSHDKLGDTGKPTGWWLSEFAHPYDEFVEAGFEVVVASPKGGKAPVDPGSVAAAKDDVASTSFLNDTAKAAVWSNTKPLAEFAADDATADKTAAAFDALFYPGGHGPVYDLANDAQSQRLATAFAAAGKVVGAVCHGPAALVNVRTRDGKYLVQGRKATGFTDDEERAVQLASIVPFLLESTLRERGADFQKGPDWATNVAVDGNLITGQNPGSAQAVGAAIVKALK